VRVARPERGAPKEKKPPLDPDAELLYAGAEVPSEAELGLAMTWAFQGEAVAPELLLRFVQHARLVLEGNRRMNLTAITEPREVAAKHYLDSWRVTRLWPIMGRSVLDVGTGAGFPGIPVALGEPQARVTLLDSTQKRVDFVAQSIRSLGIQNATAVWGRAEDFLARNDFDLVLMRGLSSVRENVRLLRKVRHSLKDLILYKGPSWSREMRAAEREAERLGFRLDTVLEHELPEGLGKRALLVYRAPGGHGR
jgi:16S rRNA (guanine527-N7)-methyltransferase